jgi:hypothetical protein
VTLTVNAGPGRFRVGPARLDSVAATADVGVSEVHSRDRVRSVITSCPGRPGGPGLRR